MDEALHLKQSQEYLRDALEKVALGSPSDLTAHLAEIQSHSLVQDTQASLHAHTFQVDANGYIRWKTLVDYLVKCRIEYAIPKRRIKEAQKIDETNGDSREMTALADEARGLFADIVKSGEGGEMLLYVLATHLLGFPQAICKMSLKTSTDVHFHGSDGVYLEGRGDGGLNLYWGESKIYADRSSAFSNCFTSLAPFLVCADAADSARQRDITLLNEHMNLGEGQLEVLVKSFLDPNHQNSLQMKYCGLALIGFDHNAYKDNQNSLIELIKTFQSEFHNWQNSIQTQVKNHNLEHIQMHVFCVPMPSVEQFRQYFAEQLGLQVGSDAAA